jgi:hypothetical protein
MTRGALSPSCPASARCGPARLVQIAHLVEQDRAALGARDHREGPSIVGQIAGRGHHEGQRAAVGEIVDRPRDQDLPVPLSPVISTGRSVFITRATSR